MNTIHYVRWRRAGVDHRFAFAASPTAEQVAAVALADDEVIGSVEGILYELGEVPGTPAAELAVPGAAVAPMPKLKISGRAHQVRKG